MRQKSCLRFKNHSSCFSPGLIFVVLGFTLVVSLGLVATPRLAAQAENPEISEASETRSTSEPFVAPEVPEAPTTSADPVAAAEVSHFENINAALKQVSEYDSEFLDKTDQAILASDELKLKLLQREFVRRVGHDKLKGFAEQSEANAEVLDWLFTKKENLEEYLLGGNPEGTQANRNEKYPDALKVLSEVYQYHKEDLTDRDNATVYKRMMMAISLAYVVPVNHWQTVIVQDMPDPVKTAQRTPSDPNERYKLLKQLFTTGYSAENISTSFKNDVFKDLEVEEMRWVVNNRTGDADIPWLNWYTQKVSKGLTAYGQEGFMNPYNYIYYAGGVKWDYENHQYYRPGTTYCADGGNINQYYSPDYKRGANCDEKYSLSSFGISPGADPYLHQWIIWEEDGVCGSIAGVGTNIQMAYGIPSSLVSQPGHAAFFQSNTDLVDWNGQHLRQWNIGNSVASWGNSYKWERMPLDWGTKYTDYWTDANNASYLLLGQRALDNMSQFRESFYYNLLANLHKDDTQKLASYTSAIKAMGYNFDSWLGVIDIALRKSDMSDKDFFDLAKAVAEHFKEFPLPMHDLLKRFSDRMEDHQIAYNNMISSLLNELSSIKVEKNTEYFQAQAVKDIANYLLGKQENTDIASFSFDGDEEHAMKLRLEGTFREQQTRFEYSIDSSRDDPKNIGSWTRVEDGRVDIDLSDEANRLSYEKDILVHALATDLTSENIYTIDLLKPDNQDITSNNLERRVVGIEEENAEWVRIPAPSEEYNPEDTYYQLLLCGTFDDPDACAKIEELDWTKFTDATPEVSDAGNQLSKDFSGVGDLYVRKTASGLYTKSDAKNVFFSPATNTSQKTYIPNSMMSVTSSIGPEKDLELKKLLDGNTNSYWISDPDDEEKYLIYSLQNPILLSDLEYVVPTDFISGRGNIVSARLEVSLTGREDDYRVIEEGIQWPFVKDKSRYSFHLEDPAYAKYIKITPLQTHVATNQNGQPVYYDRTHVSMYNFYQDTTAKIDLNLLDDLISYQSEGYTYNNAEHQPKVTIGDYDGSTLEQGKDFSLTYEDNRNAGTAKIKISGSGRYQGELIKEFTIAKAQNPPEMPEDSYEASETATKLSDIQLPNDWSWEKGDTDLTPGSELTANAFYADTQNYENASKSIKITVPAKTIDPTIPGPENPTNPTNPSAPTEPETPPVTTDPVTQPNQTNSATSSSSPSLESSQIATIIAESNQSETPNPIHSSENPSTTSDNPTTSSETSSSETNSANPSHTSSSAPNNTDSSDSKASESSESSELTKSPAIPIAITVTVLLCLSAAVYFFYLRR